MHVCMYYLPMTVFKYVCMYECNCLLALYPTMQYSL